MAGDAYSLNLGMTEVAKTGQGHTYLYGADGQGNVLFEIHGQPESFVKATIGDSTPIIIQFIDQESKFRTPLDTVPLVTGLTEQGMGRILDEVRGQTKDKFNGAEYQVPRQQIDTPPIAQTFNVPGAGIQISIPLFPSLSFGPSFDDCYVDCQNSNMVGFYMGLIATAIAESLGSGPINILRS